MLSYQESSFAGKGLYLEDSLLLFDNWRQWADHVLNIRPVGVGVSHDCFGWVCDGAMINATRGFAMIAVAVFLGAGQWQHAVPAEIVDFLSKIKVKYIRYVNSQSRMVASLVDSAVNNKTNRSVEDPIFLANELRRLSLGTASGVKLAFQMYKARLLANPALHMKESTEACTLRMLSPEKMSPLAIAKISDSVAAFTWQLCPFTAHALLAPRLPIGAKLGNWMHDFMDRHMRQNAMGQTLAIDLACHETTDGCKIRQDFFDVMSGCCGFWCLVQEHVLPGLGLGDKGISELDAMFKEKGSCFRSALGDLMLKEPPNFDSWKGMGTWLKNNVSSIKAVVQAGIEEANKAAQEDPSSILQDVEKVNISVGIYLGEVALDANAYREAKKRLATDTQDGQDAYDKAKSMHINDVRAAQNHFQNSDLVMSPSQMASGIARGGKWITQAVLLAESNLKQLAKLHRTHVEEIAVVNVWALSALGTYKSQVVHQIHSILRSMPGIHLVYLPLVPSDTHARTNKFTSLGACQQDEQSAAGADDGSASGGENDHDFNLDEGCLPEVLTKAAAKLPPKILARSLAKDHHEIERILGTLSDPPTHCWHRTRIAHKADNVGFKDNTDLLVLYPLDEDDMTGMERSAILKQTVLTEVPIASEYVSISRKVAMNAKMKMQEHWEFEVARGTSVYQCASKVGRGQLGTDTHEHVLKDLVKTCSRRVLVVNDFMRASGEVGIATVNTRFSEEAVGNNCTMCYWGYDFRPTFGEVSNARVKTHIGRMYLNGKLNVPGRTPLPVPVEPESLSRGSIQSLLPQPLKRLSVNADGDLVLPSLDSCPVPVTQLIREQFSELALEFPQKQQPASGGNPAPKADPAPGGGSDPVPPAPADPRLAPGTVLENRAGLLAGGWTILKESPAPVENHMYVLAQKTNVEQIFMENLSAENKSIDGGTFLGKGGPGGFGKSEELSPETAARSWRFTRLTDFKKDTPKHANGGLVLGPLPQEAGQWQQIKISTVSQVEQSIGGPRDLKVYGHGIVRGTKRTQVMPGEPTISWYPKMQENPDASSFTALNLSQWQLSHEVNAAENKVECKGLLRPGFEFLLDATRQIAPSPAVDANALCVFAVKKFTVKAKGLIAF